MAKLEPEAGVDAMNTRLIGTTCSATASTNEGNFEIFMTELFQNELWSFQRDAVVVTVVFASNDRSDFFGIKTT